MTTDDSCTPAHLSQPAWLRPLRVPDPPPHTITMRCLLQSLQNASECSNDGHYLLPSLTSRTMTLTNDSCTPAHISQPAQLRPFLVPDPQLHTITTRCLLQSPQNASDFSNDGHYLLPSSTSQTMMTMKNESCTPAPISQPAWLRTPLVPDPHPQTITARRLPQSLQNASECSNDGCSLLPLSTSRMMTMTNDSCTPAHLSQPARLRPSTRPDPQHQYAMMTIPLIEATTPTLLSPTMNLLVFWNS